MLSRRPSFERMEDRTLFNADAFFLHSNPDANHTIFLDFDGAVTANTVWNNYNGGQPIVTPAYDFDGNVSSFSDAELQRIAYIWERVAEDFMPFNVNVTTQDPGAAVLNQPGHKSVIIGGSSFDWWGSANAGVAYVGSFNWGNVDTPAFVFEAQLGNGDEKWTAEAISHEAGHTLGLTHDGQGATEYYAGHGGGETAWAPIMGASYYNNVTQWSKGEYANATNTQDDLLFISSYNGFSYRTDDYGNSNSAAAPLTVTNGQISGKGIIERNTDIDVLSFVTAAGDVQLNVNPAVRGPNLDIRLDLYNSSGSLVATSNQSGVLRASMNLNLPAGEYFLHVSGTGDTNYSSYGSLGQYTVSGNVVESLTDYLSVSAMDADKPEGPLNALTPYVFEVSRTGNLSGTASVDWSVSSSQADPWDFLGYWPSGTVTFAPGESSKLITVDVCGDDFVEADEQFTLTLHGASSGTVITTASAVGTIRDDDGVPAEAVVSKSEVTTSEQGMADSFTVVLSKAPTSDVTIQVQTSNAGEAVADCIYLLFTPGNWNVPQTVVITGVDDDVRDGDCEYTVTLGAAQSDDMRYQGVEVPDLTGKNMDDGDKGRKKGHGKK